jgi:hypothetical protein
MEYDPSNEEHLEIMEYLLSEGAATIESIDDDGEPVYSFDMEVLEEIMPDLHQVIQDDMDNVLIDLYQKGLIEVEYDEDLNANMNISEEGRHAMLEAGFDLDGSGEENF